MRLAPRDHQPENVLLLDRRGGLLDLRIADFGAAVEVGPSGTVSTPAGTPGYMAPENLMELPYGAAADMWSLGVLLFTLLSGTSPFEAADTDGPMGLAALEYKVQAAPCTCNGLPPHTLVVEGLTVTRGALN